MAAKKTYDTEYKVQAVKLGRPTSTHRANSDKKSATFNQEKLIFNYQLSFFTAFLASFSANSLDLSPSPFNS